MTRMSRRTSLLLILSGAIASSAAAADPPATLERTFTYAAGSLSADFELCNVRGPDFEVYEHLGGTSYSEFASVRPARTYIGTVAELPGAVAACQVTESGKVRTAILFEDGATWVGTGTAMSLPSPASWTPRYPASLVGTGGGGSNVHAADVGFDLTYTYFNQAGQNTAEAVERAEWSVMQANLPYLRDAAIFHRMARVIVRTDGTDDRSTSLSLMKSEWQSVLPVDLPGSTHDMAATVQSLGSSGLAWVGAVGTSNRYSWNSIRGSSVDGSFFNVWRHEAGHNWGAGHSEGGAPEGPTIMSGNGLSRFSSSDLKVMVAHRDSRPEGVLEEVGAWPQPLPPRANADRARARAVGTQLVLDVLDNDSDTNGDVITLEAFDAVSERGGSVVLLPGGGDGGRDALGYSADAGFTDGIDWFTYRIEDATGRQAVATVMLLPPVQAPDFTVVADVLSVGDGEWTEGAMWDSGAAAESGLNYQVAAGTTVDSPVVNGLAFPGDSLRVASGGTLRLRHTSGGGNTTQTLDLKDLILDDGATLQSYNTSAGNVFRVVQSPVGVAGGGVSIRIRSDSGGAYSNQLTLDGGLFGSGDIELTGSLGGQSGERRSLWLTAPDSPFSGDWRVSGDGTTDDSRRMLLVVDAAGGVGSGRVRLGERSLLRNRASGGLSRLAGVELSKATSTLDLVEPWIGPTAILEVVDGTVNLGAGHSRIGDLQLEGISLDEGNYTAAELNALAGTANFTGDGILSLGSYSPDAISVQDGGWNVASTWSHGQVAPVTGTQGDGLAYLVENFTVSSNDPASNQQAWFGALVRVGAGGVLELARFHGGTNQSVAYDLPTMELEDGGRIRFRASNGSCTHSVAAPVEVSGDVEVVIEGGSYSNRANLTGGVLGDGFIDVVSTTSAASAGNVRSLTILSEDNPYAGDWRVSHTASGDDFGALRAGATGALGTGTVTVGERGILFNDAVGGLDSLAAVSLEAGDASLVLGEPWRQPLAVLTVEGGTVDLGEGHSLVGSLAVDLLPVAPGIYDADDLPGSAFSGGGTLTVVGGAVPPPVDYIEWVASQAVLDTPGKRDLDSDPDSDGHENILEFLLLSDPADGGDFSGMDLELPEDGFEVRYTRRASEGFSDSIEYAADLSGVWSTATPAMVEREELGDVVEVTAAVPRPDGVDRMFVRLRVEQVD